METEIFERYKKVQDRFNLPHLEELKDAFKFELESSDKLIEQIRYEISERLFSFTERVVEPIIGASDSISTVFEQDMLTEKERETLFEMYKKVQVLKWENNLLIVKPDDKKTAEWIRKTWNLWNNELGNELVNLCRKMSHNWDSMKFSDDKTVYHG